MTEKEWDALPYGEKVAWLKLEMRARWRYESFMAWGKFCFPKETIEKFMSTRETAFENAKVGDRVNDLKHGWGRIAMKDGPFVTVAFDSHVCRRDFGVDGFRNGMRRLYWDEVTIVPPPRPKRTVTVYATVYVNIYLTSGGSYAAECFSSDGEAHDAASAYIHPCLTSHEVEFSHESEE
jgi:hypothetical protein